jgi:hypothetical protein
LPQYSSTPNSAGNVEEALNEVLAIVEHLNRTIFVTDHMITAKQIMWDRNQSDEDRAYSRRYVAWAEPTVRPTIESVWNSYDFSELLESYPEEFRDDLRQLRSMLLELEEEDKWWQAAYDERF